MSKLKEYSDTVSSVAQGAGLIGGAVESVKGLIAPGYYERRADKRQLRQTKNLNAINAVASKDLAEHEQALKMKMWQDTNYTAQLREANKAGVSKAAVLGGSGAGAAGAATGASVGAGSVGAGAASGAANQAAQQQQAMMAAQIANLNADTNKKAAETGNISTGEKGVVLDNQLKGETMQAMINMAKHGALNSYENYRSMKNANQWEDFMQQRDGDNPSPKEQQVRAEINETIATAEKINEQIKLIGKEIGMKDASIANIQADTALARQLKDHLDKTNPEQLDAIQTELKIQKKELEKMNADPSYSRWGQYINYTLDKVDQLSGIVGTVRGRGIAPTQTKEEVTTKRGRTTTTKSTTSYKK